MIDEITGLVREEVEYTEDFLERYKNIYDIYPTVLKINQRKKLLLNTLENTPQGGEIYLPKNLYQSESESFDYLKSAIPQLPEVNLGKIEIAHNITIAGCCDMSVSCVGATISPDISIKTWANDYFLKDQNFRDYDHKVNIIDESLKFISPPLVENFNEVEITQNRYVGGTITQDVFAHQMRNFLYKFNGELKTQVKAKFNNKDIRDDVFWNGLKDNFSIEPNNITISNQIMHFKENYKSLTGSLLSEPAKRWYPEENFNMTYLHSTYIDFIYSVCSLTKF